MSDLDGRRIGWLMRSRAASHHHNYQHHTNPGGFDWHQPLSDNLFIRLNAATTHQTYCATHPYSIVIYLYIGKDLVRIPGIGTRDMAMVNARLRRILCAGRRRGSID